MGFAKIIRNILRLSAVHTQKCKVQLLIASLIILFGLNTLTCAGQVNVTTWHNDIGRTGQNLNETILVPSNVNATNFGKLFSQPVDGAIFAQPLYLSNVTIGSTQHNVVFVATENDSVYAFDADTNGGANINPLWQASLLTAAHGAAAGATAFPSSELCADIVPVVGITGTPVIDPTTDTLYVVSKTLEGSNAVQRLHALDVTTGNEKFNGPVVVTATIAGTGNGSVSGQLTFDSMWENQRPGLLLLNGIVYIGFAAHGDNGPWHGWILAYNASTLAQTGIFNASANGVGSGFWMSGAGLAADQLTPSTLPYGRMFVATGNGDYTATTPYNNSMDYGDSILRLDLTNGVPTIQDEFTPSNQAALDAADQDVASGGVVVLPTQTTGSYPHLLVQSGKGSPTYLVNRDSMGGYNSTDNVVQANGQIARFGNYTTPAYWNGTVYYAAAGNPLGAFPLANSQLPTTAASSSSETYTWPGLNPSISANGTTQGIVWTIDSSAYSTSGPAVLAAHNASNVATTLYSSSTNASRDNPGPAVKFTVPTVVNGKVYVGTANQVSVYGLLAGESQAATPVLTPGTESFSNTVSVSITDSTVGAAIYYTTDGTTPTAASTLYTAPITLTSTTTINAVASASGYLVSSMASATYTNLTQTSPPVFSLASGVYNSAQTVTISDATSGATIYYSTNGTTPTTSSSQYTGPIAVSSSETIGAVAVLSGYTNSLVSRATYTIELQGAGISFSQGFANSQGYMIFNGSTDLDDTRLQLTDGGTNEESSAWYYTPVNVQSFSTTFAFQLSNPSANGITFAIQNQGTAALGDFGSGLGYQQISPSVAVKFDLFNSAGEGTDSTGLYTDGAIPTVPAIDLSSTGINLHSDDTMLVQLTYNGTTLTMIITDTVTQATFTTSWTINIPSTVGANTAYVGFTGGTGGLTASQKILTWTYTPGPVVATPTFSPAAGTYASAQTVTISDGSSGATIYYTTDGSTPTTSSTLYAGAITVSTTETIKAMAVVTGYTNSAVATAAYTITAQAATPTFSPVAGTYTSAQTVTISDATSGATIYYTTNGTTPTTSSTQYTGPIAVSATETIEAIAVATSYNNSAVATAVYTINLPAASTPTFSPAAGTYASAQTVTISSATSGATIYYTTNGTTPTASSTKYTAAITVSSSETIKALAVATGYTNSAVATAAYMITGSALAPTFSPVAGTYTSVQTVTISDGTSGATIYYTTNGTTPTTSSTLYTGPVTVSASETIEAIAVATGYTNSAVSGATYTIQSSSGTAINYSSGFAGATGQLVLNGSAALSGSLLQLTNGGSNQQATAWYATPVNVQSFSTTFNFQLVNASADGMTFAIQNQGTSALGQFGGGLGYQQVLSSVAVKFDLFNNAGEGSDSTGMYTNGAIPTTPAIDLSSTGINLHSGDTISVQLNYDGTTLTMVITDTVTQASYTTSWAINIPSTVGANTAYVGFTGGTGGQTATQHVLSWTYTPGAVVSVPTFSPAAGTYTSAQTVTISDATSGATIYYTTDGTTPTTSSTQYTGAITVSSTETIKAIAVATGYTNSSVATAAYTITTPAATPTFSPAAATYTSVQTVTISDTTSGATIYYTTNGTTPTTSSTKYTAAISVSSSETIEAIAVATGYTNSAVATAAYTINLPAAATPTFSPAAGSYGSTQTVTISDTTLGATIYYTTNGTTPTTSSTKYTAAISVSASETVKAIAVATGYTNSAVASAAYTINGAAATPTFSPAVGTYTSIQTVTISDTTSGATIYYTTNGTTPTTSSTQYTGPVTVNATETIKALAAATGYTNSAVATAAYTINLSAAATPTFSPVAGSYGSAQTVTISDTTSGATIYYTTNGTTPTTSSTQYTSSITVSSSETIKAIAVGTGFTNSAVASAAYTINGAALAPTLSLAAGTYLSAQTVTISDATSGATIYYTTNGTTPTTSSTKYTAAITVSATETIEAIAVATGYTISAVSTAAYTILPANSVLPTPTLSLATGNYTTAQTVTISDAASGVTIYYTTDTTLPTASSTKYTGPITVSSSETLTAVAVATGFANSASAAAVYLINNVLPTPTILPAGGTYTTPQSVTIRDWLNNDVYYTTDGTTPTASSTQYTGAITVSSTETIKAIVIAAGYTNSPVATAAYTIQTSSGTAINYGSGFAGAGQLVLNGSAALSGSLLQLTNGGSNQQGTAWYSTTVNVQSFSTTFSFQLLNPSADGFTFAIQNQGTSALGQFGVGLGYQQISSSVAVKFDLFNNAGEGNDSTGLYTNGAIPTMPATDLSSTGINLHSGDTMSVQLNYNGTTLTMVITDTVTQASYTTSWTINIPSTVGANTAYVGFTGGTGGQTATQNILTWTYTN